MPADSWIQPDAVPTFAAEAMARIDAALGRLPAPERDAFWASVRKCYNTPYNDPKPRPLPGAGLTRADLVAPEARMAEPKRVASESGLVAALTAIPVPASPRADHVV